MATPRPMMSIWNFSLNETSSGMTMARSCFLRIRLIAVAVESGL